VRPEYRRRGIGGALHDELLRDSDAPTAVLSTQTDNDPAIALYAGRGWQVIVPHLDFGSGRPFLIMGIDL
jgi:ribosomal protein S18 acetylase RimI-like enzyme